MLDGSEDHYTTAIECLNGYFDSKRMITVSDKSEALSQYRASVTNLRSTQVADTTDWFQFLSGHYELQSRGELHRVFWYASLCLPPLLEPPHPFNILTPELESGKDMFQSFVDSLQMCYLSVSNLSSLFRDPRSISRVFRLLEDESCFGTRSFPFGTS